MFSYASQNYVTNSIKWHFLGRISKPLLLCTKNIDLTLLGALALYAFIVACNFVPSHFFTLEACKPGYWSIDGTAACSLCPVGTFSNTFGMTRCQKCAYSQSTEIEGATSESHCQGIKLLLSEGVISSYKRNSTK